MIVEVVGGAGAAPDVRVADVDDLAHLHLAVGALTHEEIDGALREAGLGRLADASTAWLDIAALKAAAGARSTVVGWPGLFDGMVATARDQGWLGDDGATLRAHVQSAAGA